MLATASMPAIVTQAPTSRGSQPQLSERADPDRGNCEPLCHGAPTDGCPSPSFGWGGRLFVAPRASSSPARSPAAWVLVGPQRAGCVIAWMGTAMFSALAVV